MRICQLLTFLPLRLINLVKTQTQSVKFHQIRPISYTTIKINQIQVIIQKICYK